MRSAGSSTRSPTRSSRRWRPRRWRASSSPSIPGYVCGIVQDGVGYRNGMPVITLHMEAYLGAPESFDAVEITGSPRAEDEDRRRRARRHRDGVDRRQLAAQDPRGRAGAAHDARHADCRRSTAAGLRRHGDSAAGEAVMAQDGQARTSRAGAASARVVRRGERAAGGAAARRERRAAERIVRVQLVRGADRLARRDRSRRDLPAMIAGDIGGAAALAEGLSRTAVGRRSRPRSRSAPGAVGGRSRRRRCDAPTRWRRSKRRARRWRARSTR